MKKLVSLLLGTTLLFSLSNSVEASPNNNNSGFSQGLPPQAQSNRANILRGGAPQQVGLDRNKLNEIDNIVKDSIENNITPGATVLVAKEGRIVFEEAYGVANRYDMGNLVSNPRNMTKESIFDLASVTKVMGTTQAIMKMIHDGQLNLEDTVTTYLPEFGRNGKEHITVEDLLTHTSGLTPWEPVFLYTDTEQEAREYVYDLSLEYETGTDRRYSDFGFMVLGYIVEEISGMGLDSYLEQEIFLPLDMRDTFFNASEKTNKLIAATSWGNPYEYRMIDDPNVGYYVEGSPELFDGWRDYTLVGEVNDGNSFYSHQGVAGHAGLFSSANDLAVLGQTMLNGGEYGNHILYSEEIVEEFTSPQRFNQGYGWEINESWYMGDAHSGQAYGHTGFTGTQIVIDPVHELQIIVLTNKQNNGPLDSGLYAGTGGLNQSIVDTVYEAMKD